MGTSSSKPTRQNSSRSEDLFHHTITSFGGRVEQTYKVEKKVIGEGHYGTVRRCQDKETKDWYALKTINKAKVHKVDYLRREIQILETVTHPNIINVVDIFEDEVNLQIVTELCTGGELFDRIIAKTKTDIGAFTEHDAATLIRKTLLAIEHCHNEHDIVHRDLKPENFLFKTQDEDSDCVIIDFGLSKILDDGEEHMSSRVGTPYYIAPEVLSKQYTKACDIWSIGVIAYILLCGYPPFFGDNDTQIFRAIMAGNYTFPEREWSVVSDSAKEFIGSLLVVNYNNRPTATQALAHPWLSAAGEPVPLSTEIGPRLQNFCAMNELKRQALLVMANELTQAEIGDLEAVFKKIDVDNSGRLSVGELKAAMMTYPEIVEVIDDVLAGIDLGHDHEINYNEFLAATMHRNTFIKEEYIRLAYNKLDADGSGFITHANLVELLGSEKHTQEILGNVDLSGDGKISYDEFRALMRDKVAGGHHLHHGHTHTGGAEERAEV